MNEQALLLAEGSMLSDRLKHSHEGRERVKPDNQIVPSRDAARDSHPYRCRAIAKPVEIYLWLGLFLALAAWQRHLTMAVSWALVAEHHAVSSVMILVCSLLVEAFLTKACGTEVCAKATTIFLPSCQG